MKRILAISLILLSLSISCKKDQSDNTALKAKLYGTWKVVYLKIFSGNFETTNDTTGVVAEWAGYYINKFEIINDGTFSLKDAGFSNAGSWNLDEKSNSIEFIAEGHPETTSTFTFTLPQDSLYLKDSFNLIKCVRSSW